MIANAIYKRERTHKGAERAATQLAQNPYPAYFQAYYTLLANGVLLIVGSVYYLVGTFKKDGGAPRAKEEVQEDTQPQAKEEKPAPAKKSGKTK